MLRGRVLPRKFEKIYNRAKPSPRYNPAIMHRTKTCILPKIREIEAVSMGVGTLRGYAVQFIPAPWLQPTNQESQTSVNLEITTNAYHGMLLGPRHAWVGAGTSTR